MDDFLPDLVLVATPNPRALKLQLPPGSYPSGAFWADDAHQVAGYPLLEALFTYPALEGLYLAEGFLTLLFTQGTEAQLVGAELRNLALTHWPTQGLPALPPPNRLQGEVSGRAEFFRTRILPATHHDGGGLYLLEDRGTELTLEALGACRGCPYAPETVEKGILTPLRAQYPDLLRVFVQ